MANYNQAPTLQHQGSKESGTNNFYKIPQELADIIFKELGNSSAQLRIMLVLIGTKPGFKISDAWICERTGLLHPSYINARKALVGRGWITHAPATGITVNFDAIYGKNRSNTTLQNEKECSNTTLLESSNTILPLSSNTILPQSGNTILPIINNIDNKINNETNNNEFENPSQARAFSNSYETAPDGSLENPFIVSQEWLKQRHNYITKLANGLFRYGSKFYRMKEVEE